MKRLNSNRSGRLAAAWLLSGLLVAGLWSAALAAQAVAFAGQEEALAASVAWLIDAHQNGDGGFSSFSAGANVADSDVGGTMDGMLALAAAGQEPVAALAYLQGNGELLADYANLDGGSAGKAILALTAAGADPREFAGQDVVLALTANLSPTGQLNASTPFAQSLAILGLAAAGEPVPDPAVSWLQALQAADGSWDDGFGTAGNSDATAMAVMALRAAGVPAEDGAVAAAAQFLAQARLDSGGWEYAAGFGENANSTALVMQALIALEEDVSSVAEVLLSWQGETGAMQADFGNGRFDDFFTTVQSVPALSGQAYPLQPWTALASGSAIVPPTEAPPTEAPATEAPPTEAPPTEAPATEAPPTALPPTVPAPTETPAAEPAATAAPATTAEEAPAAESGLSGGAIALAVVAAAAVLGGIYWVTRRGD